MILQYKKLHPEAQLDIPVHPGDVGYDLHSIDFVSLWWGMSAVVRTGIALQVPEGYYVEARTRSGNGFAGLQIHPGIIDQGYRGEITVKIFNHNEKGMVTINKGDKICQLILHKINVLPLEEVQELESTERGDRGLGSTGK